jgi:tetratricopeptide (TPR) repeat protein
MKDDQTGLQVYFAQKTWKLSPTPILFSICLLFLVPSLSCTHTRKEVGNNDFYIQKAPHKNKKGKKSESTSTALLQKTLSADISKTLNDQASGKTKTISKISEASYWEDQNPETAQLQDHVKQNPDNAEVLFELASYYHHKLIFDKALEAYQGTLQLSRDNVKYLEAIGRLMRDWNQPQAGIEFLNKAVSISPGFLEAWNTLGTIFEGLTNFAKAQECYQKALSVNPNADFVHSNLCFSYIQSGDLPRAIVHGEKAVQLNPASSVAHNNLGIAYALSGNPSIALQHFQLAAPSNQSIALNNLGIVYLEKGKYNEAMIQFLAAAKLNPEDMTASKNYYRAQDLKAQDERALKQYAIEHSKNPAFWKEIRLTLRRLEEFPFVHFPLWSELEQPIFLPSNDSLVKLLKGDRGNSAAKNNRIEIDVPPELEEAAFDLANFLSRRKYRVTINMKQKVGQKDDSAIYYRSGLAQEAVELARQIPENQKVFQSPEIDPGTDLLIHLTEKMLPAIASLKSKPQ